MVTEHGDWCKTQILCWGKRTVKIDYKIAFMWANGGKVLSVVETSIQKLIKTRNCDKLLKGEFKFPKYY